MKIWGRMETLGIKYKKCFIFWKARNPKERTLERVKMYPL
jgi:hypothetical protein